MIKRPSSLLVCLFLIACGQPTSDQQANAQFVKELTARVEELESKLLTAQVDVDRIETQQNLMRNRFSTGVFDPADGSFQRIDSAASFGTFTVSVEDIRPYGDGVRVTLNLGNPFFVTYSNSKVSLKYGARMPGFDDPNFGKAYADWQATLKTKEEKILTDLRPGSWNPVQVTLPGVKVDQFGYLSVGVETSTISLAK